MPAFGRKRRHPIAGDRPTLQLLLILSALLGALTGAMSGRAPDLRSHQAAVVRDATAAAPARVATARPVQALPAPGRTAMPPRATAQGFARAIPLYAARRRE